MSSEFSKDKTRCFSNSTSDQIMLSIYRKLVPENEIDPMTFKEVGDGLIDQRDEMCWQYIEGVDQTCLDKGGQRIYVCGDNVYRNSYESSCLMFYDKQGQIIALTRDEVIETIFIMDTSDIADPDICLVDLFSDKKTVRILDAGIGISRIIDKVRSGIEELGVEVNASAVNIVALPESACADLDELHIGRFEQCDFNGAQYDLLYSNTACGMYTPNERKFVQQLDRIVASKGIVIMNIGANSENRWREALDQTDSFEYEFLNSIENTKRLEEDVKSLAYFTQKYEVDERLFCAACDDFRKKAFFDLSLIEGVVRELNDAKDKYDLYRNCPFLEEAFRLRDGLNQEDGDFLNYLYDIGLVCAELRGCIGKLNDSIEIYRHHLVNGILIKRK